MSVHTNVLEQIAKMRVFPDDKINRITLTAAIEMARTAVAADEALNRVRSAFEASTTKTDQGAGR